MVSPQHFDDKINVLPDPCGPTATCSRESFGELTPLSPRYRLHKLRNKAMARSTSPWFQGRSVLFRVERDIHSFLIIIFFFVFGANFSKSCFASMACD